MGEPITVFECVGLEEFLALETRAQEVYEYAHPEVLDDEDTCPHCGEPSGLADDPYTQDCQFCGRAIHGGA